MAALGSPSCYSRLETLIAKVIFLATGVWWGVGVQLMVYAGIAAEPSALLPNFTWYAPQRRVMLFRAIRAGTRGSDATRGRYASMLLGLLLSERFVRVSCCDGAEEPAGCGVSLGCLLPRGRAAAAAAKARRCAWWRLPPARGLVGDRDLVAALCDYFGTVATAMGLTLAGSGIFGIIYSSVSCWAALFSYCILGRRLVPLQVLGMAVVVAGLVVSSLENDFASDGGRRVAAGSVAIAVGTVAYGLEYALCERLLSASDAAGETPVASATDERDAAEPRRASGNEAIVEMMYYMGLWGLGLSALYTAVVVAPRWDYLVAAPVRVSGATPSYLTALVVSHTFSNWLHNLSWFIICDREGSVATGLLQGLKAVLLFGGSSLAFCDRQESQRGATAYELVAKPPTGGASDLELEDDDELEGDWN
ncbi:hypothetical protein JL721_8826 [Aureococcus anophagefferens]|nr:hypothetical protein JL721_8826 [Aureococcus anophagefferens]